MGTAITKGIRISVKPRYLEKESNPAGNRFVFAYQVEIVNESDQVVQLMSRHWHILDSLCHAREVEGEGVIGQQPVLQPGQSHTYTSWCPIEADIGIMYGTYEMQVVNTNDTFEVRIPQFTFVASAKLN